MMVADLVVMKYGQSQVLTGLVNNGFNPHKVLAAFS